MVAQWITEDRPCSTENNSGWKGPESSLLLNVGTAVWSYQLTQGFTQLGLESFWAWRLRSLSVQPHPLSSGKEVRVYLSREATSSEAVAEACKWDHGLGMFKNQGAVEICSFIQMGKFSAWTVSVPWDRTDCAMTPFTGTAWPGPTKTLPNISWPQSGSSNTWQFACKHPGLGTWSLLM